VASSSLGLLLFNELVVCSIRILEVIFLMSAIRGIVNTYGVFQAYFMASGVGNAASVAWIGSMQAFLLLAVAPICGQLFDAGHCRLMIVCGTILVFLGTLATSLDGEFSSSHEHYYWYLMAFQGVITGVGVGLLFTPAVAVVSTYFTRNRGLALGIATSGAGFGGVVYPILTRVVLNAKGFGWSMRSMAFIALITQLLPCILIRQRDDLPRRPLGGKVIDLSCLRSRKFSIFYVGVFVVFLGLFTPYFFVPAWASSVNLRVSFQHFYLLSLINAGGFFGRIIPALAADLS
jgi:MFS family permease